MVRLVFVQKSRVPVELFKAVAAAQ